MARETWEWTTLDPQFTIGGPWRKDSFSPQCEADVRRVGHLSLGRRLLVILGIYFPINHISLKWTNRFYPSYIWTHGCYSSELISPVFSDGHRFLSDGPDRFMRSFPLLSQAEGLSELRGHIRGTNGQCRCLCHDIPRQKECENHANVGQKRFCAFFLSR
jgi:hypothetical protein